MVEILLGTYNGEKYIEKQLESLINQTYKDFKVIVRDDGSMDNTVNIVNEYVTRYPGIVRLVEDRTPSGSAKANFFKLLNYAEADYVMFCDQDDYWFSNKIEVTLERLLTIEEEKGKDTPVLVYTDYQVVGADLEDVEYKESDLQVYNPRLQLNYLLVHNYVTGCTSMINKALAKNILCDGEGIQMHDWWAAIYASCFGVIENLPVKTMKYRQHINSCVGAVNIKSIKYIFNRIFDKDTKNSKLAYYKMAAEFKKQYDSKLEGEGKKIIYNFLDIPNHNKLMRMYYLLKGKYIKRNLVRMIGQLWYI